MFSHPESYCEKCQEDPCECGYDYRTCSIEWLDKRIAVLTKARDERKRLCGEGSHGIVHIFLSPPLGFEECIPVGYQGRSSRCRFCDQEVNE